MTDPKQKIADLRKKYEVELERAQKEVAGWTQRLLQIQGALAGLDTLVTDLDALDAPEPETAPPPCAD